MVGANRVELLTSCLSSKRSNQLSYAPNRSYRSSLSTSPGRTAPLVFATHHGNTWRMRLEDIRERKISLKATARRNRSITAHLRKSQCTLGGLLLLRSHKDVEGLQQIDGPLHLRIP